MYTFIAVQLETHSHLVTVNTSKLHIRCVGHVEVAIEISCSNTCRCPHPHDGIKCNLATHIMLDICYKSFTIQVSLSKYFSCEETSLLLNIHSGINTFYCYTQMIKHHSILCDWQAWSGPEGSRKLRFPDFMRTAQGGGKVVSLMHWLHLPPGNSPGTHFC